MKGAYETYLTTLNEYLPTKTHEECIILAMEIYAKNNENKMPEKLTAEEGHKGLLIGEFFETIEIQNPDYCGCGKCDYCIEVQEDDAEEYIQQKVTISWDNIKKIYRKVFEFEKGRNLVTK